jgi:hypothetical protein
MGKALVPTIFGPKGMMGAKTLPIVGEMPKPVNAGADANRAEAPVRT